MKAPAASLLMMLAAVIAISGCGETAAQSEKSSNEFAREVGLSPQACREEKPLACEQQKAAAAKKNEEESNIKILHEAAQRVEEEAAQKGHP